MTSKPTEKSFARAKIILPFIIERIKKNPKDLKITYKEFGEIKVSSSNYS